MDFGEAARRLAIQVRAGGRGFQTMRREQLRQEFGVGKLTQGQSEDIEIAMDAAGLFVYPDPYMRLESLRVYEKRHPLGELAQAVSRPDTTTEAPLARMAEVIRREREGRELRSDDVPWLDALDMLLQLVSGREPEGWDELRDDRHGTMLSRELAEALGLSSGVVGEPWLIRLATAICSLRPRYRRYHAADFVGGLDSAHAAEELASILESRNRHLREEHRTALTAAAKVLLDGRPVPTDKVEVGTLGLRRRIEDSI